MLIKFTSKDIKTCEDFANLIDTNYYASRQQFNKDKRIKDQIIGKLGELAVFYYLKSKEIEVSSPDFNIYDKSKKSWDYDLKGKDFNLHVKSQSVEQGSRYGVSWVFEQTDKHVFKKDISDNEFVSFVSVDMSKKTAKIQAILRLRELHDNKLFQPMKLAYLQTKCAVYLEDKEKRSVKQTLSGSLIKL